MVTQNKRAIVPTARLLLDAFRAFENELAQMLATKGFDNVTTGNFNVLRHLNPEGMQLTELAKDAHISKQAIGKMVRDLEHKNYVEVMPDPTDARAKHVRLTANGRRLIDLAVCIVSDMESDYQSLLGKNKYNKLRQSVGQICQWHQNKRGR